MKNRLIIPALLCIGLLVASCSSGYDSKVCEKLSGKIVRSESLTQDDYDQMLKQHESILKYLISRVEDIVDEDDQENREKLMQDMRNDNEYLKRFGYMFTFGSTLYQAEVNNVLDAKNQNTYNALNRYAEEFARLSEEL